jgi:hypothetical protein
MEMNLYALEKHVQSRLDDARAAGARAALISSLRDRGVPVSIRTMAALIRADHRRRAPRAAAGAPGA